MTQAELSIGLNVEIVTKEEYDKFDIFDAHEIGKIVSVAPMVIARAENRIAELEQERFKLHQEFKRVKARKVLDARKLGGEDRLTNATDREAWALIQPEVIDAMNAEVECVTKLKKTKVVHEYWRNQFIAARKLETRVQQENELELQSARYKA